MIWEYIQNQILGMKWLNELIGNVLAMMGLDINTRVGGSIQFFIYDVLKITVLLCFLIYVISYIQSNFPPERSKKIMGSVCKAYPEDRRGLLAKGHDRGDNG